MVCATAPQDLLDKLATAARRAFDHGPWPKMVPFERGRILRNIAASIRRDLNAIAAVETRSGGKTIANSCNEVEAAARVFDYYAGAMDTAPHVRLHRRRAAPMRRIVYSSKGEAARLNSLRVTGAAYPWVSSTKPAPAAAMRW